MGVLFTSFHTILIMNVTKFLILSVLATAIVASDFDRDLQSAIYNYNRDMQSMTTTAPKKNKITIRVAAKKAAPAPKKAPAAKKSTAKKAVKAKPVKKAP